MINGLYVVRNGQTYGVYTPQGAFIAQVYTGCDGQVFQDVECMNAITKALAKRWNVPIPKKRK